MNYYTSQLPGNLLLHKVGIRNWISFSVIVWGAIAFSMGFVKTWQQLTVTRVFLGAFEVSASVEYFEYGECVDADRNAGMLLPWYGPLDLNLAGVPYSSVRVIGSMSSFLRYKRHEVQKRYAHSIFPKNTQAAHYFS